MYIIKKKCKVELVELGEGWDGDYDPNDPNDEELFRFDVYLKKDGKWIDPGDVSYCTQLPVTLTREKQRIALEIIVDRLYDQPVSYWKKICEELSWIDTTWLV